MPRKTFQMIVIAIVLLTMVHLTGLAGAEEIVITGDITSPGTYTFTESTYQGEVNVLVSGVTIKGTAPSGTYIVCSAFDLTIVDLSLQKAKDKAALTFTASNAELTARGVNSFSGGDGIETGNGHGLFAMTLLIKGDGSLYTYGGSGVSGGDISNGINASSLTIRDKVHITAVGAGGKTGAAGANGTTGAYGTISTSGGAGSAGLTGDSGGNGGSGICSGVLNIFDDAEVTAIGGNGGTGGAGGNGGRGGHGYDHYAYSTTMGGSGGAGGVGGKGGSGAPGIDALAVLIENNAAVVANGGTGGRGGAGGMGGMGGAGGSSTNALTGADGGNSGNSGNGGSGGNGACGVVTTTFRVNNNAIINIRAGQGGVGGIGQPITEGGMGGSGSSGHGRTGAYGNSSKGGIGGNGGFGIEADTFTIANMAKIDVLGGNGGLGGVDHNYSSSASGIGGNGISANSMATYDMITLTADGGSGSSKGKPVDIKYDKVIDGGSVFPIIDDAKNTSGENVYRVPIQVDENALLTITNQDDPKFIRNVNTDDAGHLSIYLPNGTYTVAACMGNGLWQKTIIVTNANYSNWIQLDLIQALSVYGYNRRMLVDSFQEYDNPIAVELKNNSDAPCSYLLGMAVYKEGRLISLKWNYKITPAGETKIILLYLTNIADTIKIFVWDGAETLNPMMPVTVLKYSE